MRPISRCPCGISPTIKARLESLESGIVGVLSTSTGGNEGEFRLFRDVRTIGRVRPGRIDLAFIVGGPFGLRMYDDSIRCVVTDGGDCGGKSINARDRLQRFPGILMRAGKPSRRTISYPGFAILVCIGHS